MDDDGFRALLRTQDGVFSLTQAHEAGFSAGAIRRRVRRGEWARAGPRVFQVAGHARTDRARVFATMLSLGPRATLLGRSALWWWRLLDDAPAILDVAVPRGCEPEPRPGVRIHRRDVDPSVRAVVDGVAVTHRAPAVLDAVVELGVAAGSELVDRALLRGQVSVDGLRAARWHVAARPGAEAVRRVIDLAAGGARFEAERRAHTLLHDAEITGWTANLEVRIHGWGDVLLDIAFDELRVAVEIDGWAYHRDQRAFVRDRARQNALVAAGWTVLRTTWHQLTTDPRAFLDALVAVLAAARARAV